MAMRGKNCVAIAADRRFGIQAQMVTTDFQKIFPMGERLYIGLAGLATDVQTVWASSSTGRTFLFFLWTWFWLRFVFRAQRLKFRLNLYELKEGRQIKPKTFMSMVSNLLYERRWASCDLAACGVNSSCLSTLRSPQVWTILHRAGDCWTRSQKLWAIHLLSGSDRLPHGDRGLRGERHVLGADVWDVRVSVGARHGWYSAFYLNIFYSSVYFYYSNINYLRGFLELDERGSGEKCFFTNIY